MSTPTELPPTALEPAPRLERPTPIRRRSEWRAPTGLLLLSAIPVLAGAVRMAELGSGAEITVENARFFDSPVPIVSHIVSVTLFSVLGALQFVPPLRARRRRWHRWAGRVVAPAGLVAALSGLWMTFAYDLPDHDNGLLALFRLLAGSAMAFGIVKAVVAVRHRDGATHRAWMTRAYALGLGAGTQALILGPWELVVGAPGAMVRAWLMGAGWSINLFVAERAIRGTRRRRRGRPSPGSPRAWASR